MIGKILSTTKTHHKENQMAIKDAHTKIDEMKEKIGEIRQWMSKNQNEEEKKSENQEDLDEQYNVRKSFGVFIV